MSDPMYECQWHLDNTGQSGGVAGVDIGVEEVWADGHLGAGIGVAVVDSGLHAGHPDLVENVDVEKNHNYVEDRSPLYYSRSSQGTGVAGVVAARDNQIGGRGVAPRATLYGYNLLRDLTTRNLVDAMTREMSTTAVSNHSWGWPDSPAPNRVSGLWREALATGIKDGYQGKGVVYVWAAGDGARFGDRSSLGGYGNHHGVTAVCAVNDEGVRTGYSEAGSNLWVCAPSNDSRVRPVPSFGWIATTANYDGYR